VIILNSSRANPGFERIQAIRQKRLLTRSSHAVRILASWHHFFMSHSMGPWSNLERQIIANKASAV
jgi:hypothetical protein